MTKNFSEDALRIDAAQAVSQITEKLREQVLGTLRRRGLVVGLSGGVDSSVVASLAVRALGMERALALFMPERDSSDDALRLGRMVAETLGIPAHRRGHRSRPHRARVLPSPGRSGAHRLPGVR